jgi:NAD(P)H-dependent flavin oxidoreductase YrpB (nitropropane dioxygenase family)
MHSSVNAMLEIDFPLLAFTHCRDVVVEVSKAGGMGVLGATGMSAEQLEIELAWIDEHIDDKPYGVDLIIPTAFESKDETVSDQELVSRIPDTHRDFVLQLLDDYDIDRSILPESSRTSGTRFGSNIREAGATALLDVAFAHPIGLIANALGTPPPYMLERSKAAGVPVAALIGTKEQAVKQSEAGVDIIVAVGGEAGGHCGDISTLVLVPEVVKAIEPYGDIPILAAGGIVTGRQMAACMAMGAAGAWTGSVWLTTSEAETSSVVKEKMQAASSQQTVRSKARTGKYSRQLQTEWTDAWESEDAPPPLPMPLQFMLTDPVMRKINKLAEGGHEGAKKLAGYFVGQGVGMMNDSVSARTVVYEFMEDFLNASERLKSLTEL